MPLMGKSTISMCHFQVRKLLNYRRVPNDSCHKLAYPHGLKETHGIHRRTKGTVQSLPISNG